MEVSGLKRLENSNLQQIFTQPGDEWLLSDELVSKLQEFKVLSYISAIRHLIKLVNDLWYQMFRQRQVKLSADSFSI